MSAKGKLIACGAVAGGLFVAFMAVEWNLLVGVEGREYEGSATPDTAKIYLLWADGLEYQSSAEYRMMHLSPTMMAHLDQRRREAAAHEATLPKPPAPLSDSERRKKIRDDYEASAKSLHLAPDMAAAMLALIDDANARHDGIPYRFTKKIDVKPGDDRDLELLTSSEGVPPVFDPAYGCRWDLRLHSEPIELTNLGVDKTGIFITVILKDAPAPLVLTQTVAGERSERTVRRLGGMVDVNVVPPNGAPVHATHEIGLGGFSIDTKVRQGKRIEEYEIYNQQIHTIASNACFEVCRLIGTRDGLPDEH